MEDAKRRSKLAGAVANKYLKCCTAQKPFIGNKPTTAFWQLRAFLLRKFDLYDLQTFKDLADALPQESYMKLGDFISEAYMYKGRSERDHEKEKACALKVQQYAEYDLNTVLNL